MGSECAKNGCLSIPNGSGSLLEKHVFDPFLTLFWSQNDPFSRHFGIFHCAQRVTTGSKPAKNTCLSIPGGLGTTSEKNFFSPREPWLTHRWPPPCAGRAALLLGRHKLPTPHLALWSTEVHVVVRGKVCEKGCYFLGTQTPLVATCKNKVCISNICHYLHFWKHTDFQNKDIQSPKYSVVLHLDHCIPVCGGGGGGCLFFSPLCSRLITEPPIHHR